MKRQEKRKKKRQCFIFEHCCFVSHSSDLAAKSNTFYAKFLKVTCKYNRIKNIAKRMGRNHQTVFARVSHFSLECSAIDFGFLNFQEKIWKRSGKIFFLKKNFSLSKFINRLLTKRPVVFCLPQDKNIFIHTGKVYSGQDTAEHKPIETIVNNNKRFPYILENFISYDSAHYCGIYNESFEP